MMKDGIRQRLDMSEKKEIRININEPIKVKLTDYGKVIYFQKYNEVNKYLPKFKQRTISFPKVDEDGYSSFQLWDFMEIYGSYFGMGRQEVIKPIEIVYEVEE